MDIAISTSLTIVFVAFCAMLVAGCVWVVVVIVTAIRKRLGRVAPVAPGRHHLDVACDPVQDLTE